MAPKYVSPVQNEKRPSAELEEWSKDEMCQKWESRKEVKLEFKKWLLGSAFEFCHKILRYLFGVI